MKKSAMALSIFCVILMGVCAWQARELARAKQQFATVRVALQREQAARAEQESASQYLERRERDWKEKAMQLSAMVGTLRSAQSPQGSNGTRVARASDAAVASQTSEAAGSAGGMFGKGMGAMLSKMLKDPGMKEVMQAQQKVAVKKMYGPLIADLQLPPEQQQKLTDLLLDQQMQMLERSQDMFKEDGVDFSKIAEASKEREKENDAAIQELLGPEKFAEFQEYKKTMTERMQLGEFKEQLQETGRPLRDELSKQLLAVMKEERERYPPAFDANAGAEKNFAGLFEDGRMERQIQWQEDVNQRVQERLASVLTPEQLKGFVAMQEQQLSMQKFGIKMAREMFGKGAPAPGAAPPEAPAVQK